MSPTPDDLESLFELIRRGSAEERANAVREIGRAGALRRGDRRVRGSAVRAAVLSIAAQDLDSLMASIGDARWEVRRDAVLALGEWSGDSALPALDRLARS